MITEAQFDQLLDLQIGDKMLVTVETKMQQRSLIKEFQKLIEARFLINPLLFSQLKVYGTFNKGQLLVIVERIEESSIRSLIKKNGEFHLFTPDPLRHRKIELMIRDGLSIEEANELVEGGLSLEEKKLFKLRK